MPQEPTGSLPPQPPPFQADSPPQPARGLVKRIELPQKRSEPTGLLPGSNPPPFGPSKPVAAGSGPPPLPAPPTVPDNPGGTLFFQRRAARKTTFMPFIVGAILLLGILVLGAFMLLRRPSTAVVAKHQGDQPVLSPEEARRLEDKPVDTPTPAPAPTVEVRRALPVETAAPAVASTSGSAPPSSSPAAAPASDTPPNLDIKNDETANVRNDVLTRIDTMPDVSQANKDKLYAAVDRARRMGRITIVPFDKGRITVSESEIARLKQRAQAPEIKALMDDPTAVFVVLGYADQKGDAKMNEQISISRARSVLDALRDQCGFQNVMHAVGMGGSALFSKQEADKNRVAEVWVVLP